MKKFRALIFIVAMSLSAQYCDSDSKGALGEGGPDVTPDAITEETSNLKAADSSDVFTAVVDELQKAPEQYAGNEDAEDEAQEQPGEDALDNLGEALAEQEGDVIAAQQPQGTQTVEAPVETPQAEETARADQEAEDETSADVEEDEQGAAETPADEAVSTSGMTVTLDTTAGRWYTLPEKKADPEKKRDAKNQKALIKEYRKKIKELSADLEKAQKESASRVSDNASDKAKEKTAENAAKKVAGIQAEIDRYLDLIAQAREKAGYGQNESGIYTYWARENLRLSVRNVTTAGWYSLRVVAKNYGALPSWYSHFNIAVINEREDEEIGGITVKASDTMYHRGAVDVYLEKGNTDLNLLWTNDAYQENEYDANIQIKRVTLKWSKKASASSKRPVRNAHEYTSVDGRFFWDNNSAWTYWANQTLGFSFPDLEPGKYEVTVMGKNYGTLPLPVDYDYFAITVDADGTSGEARVPAAVKGWRKGSVTLDITGGTNVYLTWTNDRYSENEYDTNFQFKKLMLRRVGDSERSALAAYLLGTKSGNRVLMTGVLLGLVGLIAMISIWNRSRARKHA